MSNEDSSTLARAGKGDADEIRLSKQGIGEGGLFKFFLNDTYSDRPCQITSCLTNTPTSLYS